MRNKQSVQIIPMTSNKKTFSIISLGCPKNMVDSEVLKGKLIRENYLYVDNIEESETVIVNTCGFIEQAREESIETVFETLRLKRNGFIKKVCVVGCLSQRYREFLRKEMPEADLIAGVNSQDEVVEAITGCVKNVCAEEECRSLMTPGHFAYLKIAEGCNNVCSFCSIPLIRGRQKSRYIGSILQEAVYLKQKGVKEIILIAQDLTQYGTDLPGKSKLVDLLEELLQMNLFPWVRIMYNNPDFWLSRINRLFEKYPALCPYVDIPIQNASDRILKLMNRGKRREGIKKVLKTIRREVPNVVLRTSVMVGFPSETDVDFNQLLDFIEEIRFERLGVFTYSQEEGTEAANLLDDVSPDEKERRKDLIMQLQWDISHEFAQSQVGKEITILIESQDQETYTGRSAWDAPEIDCSVQISSKKALDIGEFYPVMIIGAEDLDLKGSLKSERLNRT